VSRLTTDTVERARELIALYPQARSALVPLCHLAQQQDGWLSPEAIEDVAALLGLSPAEVRGTATLYDMLHTEPVGTYLVSVCTNIACLLDGAAELLEHAEGSLGVGVGGTTADGSVTLEEAECLADCDRTPCVQVNHRYVGAQTPSSFDQLIDDLRAGRLSGTVPPHGTLIGIPRSCGLRADPARVADERAAMRTQQASRAAASSGGRP
jgi:NADH-quinone oxidoreductase E subunit